MLKKSGFILGSFIILSAIIFFIGPKPKFGPIDAKPSALDIPLIQLDSFVNSQEKNVRFLKKDNQARIIWHDSIRTRTEYALVYIHGFSASQGEGFPLHLNVARALGANLYLSRLPDHGISSREAFRNLTPADLVNEAKEAIAIGKLLGEKLIVMACSTGGTLSIYLASGDPGIAALILLSPNIAIRAETAKLITGHWGRQIAEKSVGEYREIKHSGESGAYWSDAYHVNGLIALQSLIDQTMTPEVFRQIKIPVYVGYYYKNEKEQDPVVSVDAILRFRDQLQMDTSKIEFDAFPDAGNHVIGSIYRNPNWSNVEKEVRDFLANELGIALRDTIVNDH